MRHMTCREVLDLLADPASTDAQLLEVFELVHDRRGFSYRLREDVSIDDVECLPQEAWREPRLHRGLRLERLLSATLRHRTPATRGMLLLVGLINHHKQQQQNQRFGEALLEHPDRPVVVAEGDSWFNYPIELRDMVDHLGDHLNVYTVAAAGDTIAQMASHVEHLGAIEAHRPAAMVISGGGNDLLFDMRPYLRTDGSGSGVERFLDLPATRERIADITAHHRALIARTHGLYPELPILLHGYDYLQPYVANPRGLGPWPVDKQLSDAFLKAEYDAVGVPSSEQPALTERVVDLFAEAMEATAGSLAASGAPVHYVELRGTLRHHQWANAIHPDTEGFGLLTDRVLEALARIW